MLKFILIRLLQMIPVLVVISALTFFMVRLAPGGPFSQERQVDERILEKLNEAYGLNDPMPVQYWNFLVNITPKRFDLEGILAFDLERGLGIDFGPSYAYEGRTVNGLIRESFPVSLQLGLTALLIALLIGIPVGTLAALKPNTRWDYIPMSSAMVGICLPTFVLGPLLVLVFAMWLDWFPPSQWSPVYGGGFWETVRHRFLPCLTLGFYYAAGLARLTRGGVLEVMSQDYIRTARAKGLSEWTVVVKHGLRAGLTPVVSYLGPVIAAILSGSFIIEMIFQVPGLGRHFINAASNRDYTMVMGTVMFYATFIILMNLVVDVILVAMNPKLKFQSS